MEKRYRVTLTEAERRDLQAMVSKGKAAARKLVRARILLLADQADGGPAKADVEIVDALGCARELSSACVKNLSKKVSMGSCIRSRQRGRICDAWTARRRRI